MHLGNLDATTTTPDGLTLEEVYSKLQMIVLDLDDNRTGIESRDAEYGIEVLKKKLDMPLGLKLEEVAAGSDGRGLVLVADCVDGSSAAAAGFTTGDILTWIGDEPKDMTRIEGVDFDTTLASISNYADRESVTVVAKRLVKRQAVKVIFDVPNGEDVETTMLSGSNLRDEMIRKEIPVYDPAAKRFDQPYASGNCGGEGICGTCFVQVKEGAEFLTSPDGIEQMALRKYPARWRLSCRTVVGKDNEKDAKVTFRAVPTSALKAEAKRR
jgi:ferredoxin